MGASRLPPVAPTLRWKRIVAAMLADLELTHVQFVLLAGTLWLEHKGAPPSQRELADHAGTDEMMTSQVLRTLARRRLIPHTGDGQTPASTACGRPPKAPTLRCGP